MESRTILDSSYSGLLSLPTELRCHIYDYVLSDSQAITISVGHVTKSGSRVQTFPRKTDIPGLPHHLIPLAKTQYDASLLHAANPPQISIEHGWPRSLGAEVALPFPAPLSLSSTCHLINDEMTDYKRRRAQLRIAQANATRPPTYSKNAQQWVKSSSPSSHSPIPTNNAIKEANEEGLSLYVSYPYGILVLRSLYPYLLKQASRVYIAGYHAPREDTPPSSPRSTGSFSSDGGDSPRLTPTNSFEAVPSFRRSLRRRSVSRIFSRQRSTATQQENPGSSPTRPRLRLDTDNRRLSTIETPFPTYPSETTTIANGLLSQLTRTVLPPEPTPMVKLTTHILYPGDNSYSNLWSDINSPVIHMLRNMCGGRVNIRTVNGSSFVGLIMTAEPNPQARIVSNTWEKWKAGGNGTRGTQGGAQRGVTRMRRRAGEELEKLDQFFEFK